MQVCWRGPRLLRQGTRVTADTLAQLSLLGGSTRPNRRLLLVFATYGARILVPHFRPTSVFGFALLAGICVQMLSGMLLALFYLPDPAFVIFIREILMTEVWWYGPVYKLHVLGVDALFVLTYAHVLKKVYLKNFAEGDLDGWFTGVYAFLVYHLVVFLGITLSTTHLGDVTVTIAANIYWSLLLHWHQAYVPAFGNKHLSTEQLTRFMLAHYVSAGYYTYLVQAHVIFIHEMGDADANRATQQSATTPKASGAWDALKREAALGVGLYCALILASFLLAHPDGHSISYGYFEQWSETEVEEINFFIVAPHWYFRPHMGLLIVCAQHYEGLAWLALFYLLLSYLPRLARLGRQALASMAKPDSAPMRFSGVQEAAGLLYLSSLLYTGSSLPCGRFYYEAVEGFVGNAALRGAYLYTLGYMGAGLHVLAFLEAWWTRLAGAQADGVAVVPQPAPASGKTGTQ